MTLLWHFTCAHAIVGIVTSGQLRPYPQMQLDGRALVWLTDLADATRQQLNLTSPLLRCDRTAYRVPVETDLAVPWTKYLLTLPRELREVARHRLHLPGTLPAHWWVAETTLPIRLDGVPS